jgi:P4 family phage/plasmid primase-like protien
MLRDVTEQKKASLQDLFTFCQTILKPGTIHEVRALFDSDDPRFLPSWRAGLYDNPHALARAAHAATWAGALAVYCTPNPATTHLRSRVENPLRLKRIRKGDGLTDAHISERTCLLIDIDPIKPDAGISSSDEEVQHALMLMHQIGDDLVVEGWPEPVRAFSGNGAHLIFRIDLANDEGGYQLVKDVLKALAEKYNTERCSVDLAVSNAARLWKLPGTWARKGIDDVEGDPSLDLPPRPHRLAQLLAAPENWASFVVSERMLREFVPEPEPAPTPKKTAPSSSSSSTSGDYAVLREIMQRDLSWVDEALAAITPDVPRNDWLMVGRALQVLFGDSAVSTWDQWSSSGQNYQGTKDIEYNWGRLPGEGVEADEAVRIILGMAKPAWVWKDWYRRQNPTPRPPATPPSSAPTLPTSTDTYGLPPYEIDGEELGVITSALSRQLATPGPDDNIVLPRTLDDTLHVWSRETGLWTPIGEGDVSRVLESWQGKVVIGWKKGKEGEEPEPRMFRGKKASRSVHNELLTRCHWQGDSERPTIVTLHREALRFDTRTRQLVREPLTPDHLAQHGHAHSYDEIMSADAPQWRAYLHRLFEGSEDQELRVQYLRRWIACAVFGASVQVQAPCLILKGKGGSGKSTLVKIVEMLMPKGSVSSIAPHEWANEQSRANLAGSLLNIQGELGTNAHLHHVALIKAIVFGDPVTAKVVFRPPITFRPRAAHLWAGNGLPNIPGADEALWKRFHLLEVTGTPIRDTKEVNTSFAEDLIDTELAGILGDLARAMSEVGEDWHKDGYSKGLPLLESSEEEMEQWKSRADAVSRWVHECCTYDPSLPASRSPKVRELYHHYCAWCRGDSHGYGTGFAPGSEGTFMERLERHFALKTRSRYPHAVGAVYTAPEPSVPPIGFDS